MHGGFLLGIIETDDQTEWKVRCQIIEFGAVDAAGPACTCRADHVVHTAFALGTLWVEVVTGERFCGSLSH